MLTTPNGDERIAKENDRRTLLGIYASWQFQYAAFVFAAGAALFGEVGLFFQMPINLLRAFIFSAIPPTFLVAWTMLRLARLEGYAINDALGNARPTRKEAMEKIEEASSLLPEPRRQINDQNDLGLLDTYYTALSRLRYKNDYLLRQVFVGYNQLASVLGVVYLVVFVVCILALWFAQAPLI